MAAEEIALDYQFLSAERSDHVVTVWLDRPPVNAVNQEMYREIKRLFSDVTQLGSDALVIVLGGRGKHFCAGNDLEEFRTLSPENSSERMKEVRESFWAIRDCPLPVIAAVHGTALGTGLAIAASCDFIVAAEGARMGVPEISVGVMGAGKHLRRLVSEPILRSMFFSGDPVPVEELAKLGAVVEVVAPGGLHAAALERAGAVTRHSPVAVRYAKRSLNEIEFMDLKTGYEHEQSLTGELSGFDDSKESLRAFFERRPPNYTGR